jgi:hypothetical protein
MWDYNMNRDLIDYPLLAEKALNGTLINNELCDLTLTLQVKPELILEWGITPDKFPALIKSYPDIAVLLLAALKNQSRQAEYFKTLFSLPLNNELAGIIVRVQNMVEIPMPEYESFVNKAMDDCMKVEEEEKDESSKKVRQALIVLRIILNYLVKVPEFLSLVQQDTLDKVILSHNLS